MIKIIQKHKLMLTNKNRSEKSKAYRLRGREFNYCNGEVRNSRNYNRYTTFTTENKKRRTLMNRKAR